MRYLFYNETKLGKGAIDLQGLRAQLKVIDLTVLYH